MPSKIWAVGEEVLAADFNDFVQEQVVSTFANAAARDAALPAPNIGQTCYLQDGTGLQHWDGTAWRNFGKGRLGATTPPNRDNAPGGNVVHASVAFTLPVARIMRGDANIFWQCVTAAMVGSASCSLGFDGDATIRFAPALNAPVNTSYWGCASVCQSLAAGAHTLDLKAINAATGGTQRLTSPNGNLWVTDVGGI